MSYLTSEAQRDHLLNDKGPFRSLVVDKNASITAGSGEVADGSWDRPYTTIQAAIDALPLVGVDADHDAIGTVIQIMEGQYTENLTFSGEGFLWLVAQGAVVLTGTISYTATGNTNDNNALIMLSLFRAGFLVSGEVSITDGGGGPYDVDFTAYGCNFFSNVTAPAHSGIHSIEMRRCEIDGNVVLPNADSRFIENCNFNGNLTLDSFGERITDCRFGGDITLTTGWSHPRGYIASSSFSGGNTFSGPAGCVRLDPASEYWFDTDGMFLGGSASKTQITSVTGGGGGGGGPTLGTNIKVVDPAAGGGGTGGWGDPYNSLNTALNAKPSHGSNPTADQNGWILLLMPGLYDEDISWTGEGLIVLHCLGDVTLATSVGGPRNMAFNWDADTDNNNGLSITGAPGLYTVLGAGGHTVQFNCTGTFTIDNPTLTSDVGITLNHVRIGDDFTMQGIEGTVSLLLNGCLLDGNLDGSTLVGPGLGDLNVLSNQSEMFGTTYCRDVTAITSSFEGDVEVTTQGLFRGVSFGATGTTLTAPAGNTALMDGFSYNSFLSSGWSVASPTTLVTMIEDNQVGPHDTNVFLVVDGGYTGMNQRGTWQHPYSTISAALSSLSAPTADTHDALTGAIIFVVPGRYDESLTIPSGMNISLFTDGQVQLGDSDFLGLTPGTAQDITWQNTTNAVGPFTLFNMWGPGEWSWIISGDMLVNDNNTGGIGQVVRLKGVRVGGLFDGASSVGTGSTVNLYAWDTEFGGNFSTDGEVTAYECTFESTVDIVDTQSGSGSLNKAVNCVFTGDTTIVEYLLVNQCVINGIIFEVTASSFTAGDSCMTDTLWAPGSTFTGLKGMFQCDARTWGSFKLNNCTLNGGAGELGATEIPAPFLWEQYCSEIQFTTTSIAASGDEDFNLVLNDGEDDVLIVGIKVEQDAGTSTGCYIEAYNTDNGGGALSGGTLQAALWGDSILWYDVSASPGYGPKVSVSGVDLPHSVPLHDYDATNELHLRVVNGDGLNAGTWTITIKYQPLGSW